MDQLSDVLSCLRGLDSSKVTDRKKSVVRLGELLETRSVIEVLDSNTEQSESSQSENRLITWNVILKGVNKYIDAEISVLQSAKESQSTTTQTNREKKKRELASLFKLVVKGANQRGTKLKWHLILDSVLSVLSDEFTLEAMGADYSAVLLKSMLRVREYWLKIPAKHWRKLLSIFCKLYEMESLDSVLLSRIILELIQGNVLQGELLPRKLFQFFTKVMENHRNLKAASVIENLLRSLNIFCQAVAPNCRAQLCQFGESQMNAVIYLWGRASTEKIKEELVEFLHLLIKAHHPAGVSEPKQGACSPNRDLWKRQLISLHEMILTDVDEMAGRYKFSSGSKVTTLKSCYIKFTADIFKQMPGSKLASTDLTLLPTQTSQSKSQGDRLGSAPAKRIRLSIENKSLLEIIRERSNTLQAIPWLQILHCLLEEYPVLFNEENLVQILEVNGHLLAKCKRGQLFPFLFEVLSALVKVISHHGNLGKENDHLVTAIWSNCVSAINSRQAEVDGYQDQGLSAMSAIISAGLITPRKEIWNFFLPNFSKPSLASDKLLTSLISSQGIPENHIPSIVGVTADKMGQSQNPAFPLRQSLVSWLLPVTQTDWNIQSKTGLTPFRVANLIFALTLQDPSDFDTNSVDENVDAGESHSDMETVYLKTTFDHWSQEANNEKINHRKSTICRSSEHISAMLDFLVRYLKKLLEDLDPTVQTLDHQAWFSCFLTRLLFLLGETNSVANEVLPMLKKIIEKCAKDIVCHVKKEGMVGLLSALSTLSQLLVWEAYSNHQMFWIAEVVRSCLPATFVDLLIDIACGKMKMEQRKESKPSSPRVHHSRHRVFSDQDWEMASTSWTGMDFTHNNSNGACHDNGGGMDEVTDQAFNDEDTQKPSVFSKDANDYMNKENLSEGHQTRLVCVDILCQLTSFDRRLCREWPDWLSVKSGMNIDHAKGRLLSLISSHSSSQPMNLHLLTRITKHLLSKEHHVTNSDIKSILAAFKPIATELSQDQLACCVLLSSLGHIVPHLGHADDLPSEELKYCRDVFFKFISTFWILASEGIPKLKLELAKILLELLKHDPYSTWGHLRIKSTEEEGTFDLSTVGKQFPKLLQEENILVRTFVAESLTWLFLKQGPDGTQIFISQNVQTRSFDSIFMLCSELLSQLPGDNSQPERGDEITNCTAACLQALLTIMSSSPVCQKQCLLGLCQMVAYQDIPLHIGQKVLRIISHKLNYPSVQSYLSCHMSYLVHNWLNEEMMNSPITELPVQLLGYKDISHFVRSCQELIVSETLITKLSINDVVSTLPDGLDLHTVLMSAVPGTLIHILPHFAMKLMEVSDSGENSASVSRPDVQAGKCYSLLKQHLEEKEINECVCQKLGDIVVKILNCLTLSEEKMEDTSMVYPQANPPCYNQQVVRITLDYLAQNFTLGNRGSKVTLISVLAKVPDGLHQVLLSLSTLFWKEHRAYERLRQLKMYGLFVGMLLKDLDQGLEGGWAAVIREVINRLLILLEDRAKTSSCVSSPSYEEETILTGLNILHNVCKKAIQICPDEMANYIHRTVDTVSSLVSKSQSIGESALDFLTTVTTVCGEESEDLTNAMRMLNPLPNTPGLEQLRVKVERLSGDEGFPLAVRFSKLLKVLTLMANTPSQGLRLRINQLTDHIVHNHQELDAMTRHPEHMSQLKKVILELVRMVSSPCSHLATASAACLGAIGPVDLQTLSLSWQPNATSYTLASELYQNHEFDKYCWLFHSLDNCLLDQSLEVVMTAGQILKNIMATSSSAKFESDYSARLKDQSFLFHYLHPYKGSVKKMAPPPPPTQINLESFKMIDKSDLWLGRAEGSNLTHGEWIKSLTSALLQTGAISDEILSQISPMCLLKVKFCEESLPFLIHDILKSGVEEFRKILSGHFTSFFHSHCEAGQIFPGEDSTVASPVYMKRDCVLTMLNVVQYLRKQDRPTDRRNVAHTAWDNNFWLDLNYMDVAKADLNCNANFSAILYAEIWWNICKMSSQGNSTPDSPIPLSGSQSQGSSLDPLTLLSSQGERDQGLQPLLLKAYRSIGDPDGIYGCGAGRLAEPMARVQTYLHENQQEKALTTLDIEVSHNRSTSMTPFLQTIQSCGTDFILQRCLQGADNQWSGQSTTPSKEVEEFRFQVAWTLGQWDVPLPAKQTNSASFDQSMFQALVSLRDGHLQVARKAVDCARLNITKSFEPGLESCRSLYPILCQLQCLTHLDQVLINFDSFNKCQGILPSFQDIQRDPDSSLLAVDFDFKKPLLHLLATLGKVLAYKGVNQGETLEVNALWKLAVNGRKAKHFQLAEKALAELQTKVKDTMPTLTPKHLQLEEAKLFWARCESNIAINVLKDLLGQLKKKSNTPTDNSPTTNCLYPEALGYYGNWLAETKLETPTVIINDYLEKTVELMMADMSNSETSTRTSLEAFLSLARFADEQYQEIADYMKSPTYQEKRNLLKRSKSELESCREFRDQNIKYLKVIEKNSQIDQQEMESLEDDHRRYLHQALVNYIRCLGAGNVHDLKVFRLVALWFDNCETEDVNILMQEAIRKLTSYKFLPLFYQLAARMSSKPTEEGSFQLVLNQLMEQVARDHPHHAMWIILALAHAYKDDEILAKDQTSKKRGKLATAENEIAEADRVQAAKNLVEKLKTGDRKMADVVGKMERLCEAYIELANWKVTNEKDRRPQPLPKSLAIMKLPPLDNVLLPSVEMPVDPSCSYNNLISPGKFGSHVKVIGGINLPKIITCQGSDGRERTQLVKGKDDLRQDAVMQQVFSLVNQLLIGDEETKQRQLSIRTYKVIPLSQKCGLLQWCDGTQPLGEYLIGTTRTNGAHSRYMPKDWFFKECRDHLNRAGNKADARFKAYQEICAHFKPVFRHFFMENFVEPSVWFERRLAYTRSVATNSIVGYILGLGDRHLMNILIDLQTAELVHIDLGIAFEQGRILPTPETVPFRLTRDIVDGMGVTGVEGVFRRCCEKTMEVMKNSSESLLTIVQVLLYDPLSHWSLTPQQTLIIQRKRDQANLDTLDTSIVASGQVPFSHQIPASGLVAGPSDHARNEDMKEHQNKLAERTLLRLKQKLCGQEDRASLSVSGQVNLLIQKASNPRNLCKLFAGWQPYL